MHFTANINKLLPFWAWTGTLVGGAGLVPEYPPPDCPYNRP